MAVTKIPKRGNLKEKRIIWDHRLEGMVHHGGGTTLSMVAKATSSCTAGPHVDRRRIILLRPHPEVRPTPKCLNHPDRPYVPLIPQPPQSSSTSWDSNTSFCWCAFRRQATAFGISSWSSQPGAGFKHKQSEVILRAALMELLE